MMQKEVMAQTTKPTMPYSEAVYNLYPLYTHTPNADRHAYKPGYRRVRKTNSNTNNRNQSNSGNSGDEVK